PAGTYLAPAGSSSASRQAYMSGGAIQQACAQIRTQLLERIANDQGISTFQELDLNSEVVRTAVWEALSTPIEKSAEFHHEPTEPLTRQGQGRAHVAFAFAAHRAVVEVDKAL